MFKIKYEIKGWKKHKLAIYLEFKYVQSEVFFLSLYFHLEEKNNFHLQLDLILISVFVLRGSIKNPLTQPVLIIIFRRFQCLHCRCSPRPVLNMWKLMFKSELVTPIAFAVSGNSWSCPESISSGLLRPEGSGLCSQSPSGSACFSLWACRD